MRPRDMPFIAKTIELQRDRTTVFGATAFELCRGAGIEVGAVNCPFDLEADVQYLDQHDSNAVAAAHANDPNVAAVLPVSFVASRPPYRFLADQSFDFVVASHVVEHLPNPLAAITEFVRVVRTGGVVYLVVPHKDYCFDRARGVTPLQHFVTEYLAGVVDISMEHCLEHVFDSLDLSLIDPANGADAIERARALHRSQQDFHVHTFTEGSFWTLMDWIAPRIGAEVVHRQWNDLNIHCALRRVE